MWRGNLGGIHTSDVRVMFEVNRFLRVYGPILMMVYSVINYEQKVRVRT